MILVANYCLQEYNAELGMLNKNQYNFTMLLSLHVFEHVIILPVCVRIKRYFNVGV